MMDLLRRLHTAILARFVQYYRTKEIVKVFKTAHAIELKNIELQYWPLTVGRQGEELRGIRTRMREEMSAAEYKQYQEVAAVRAGRMDAAIVDRRSWQWPFMPSSVQRLAMPISKNTPYNLRRMSRTPVPRRAINLIKDSITALRWDIVPIADVPVDNKDEQKERCRIARKVFQHPNNTDSMQMWEEKCIEDLLLLGAYVSELELTLDPDRPMKMWAVNIESIRLFPSWSESTPDMPRYAQMTGLKGERGAIIFYDDQMMYLLDNPSTDSPFGLGKMEIAFSSVADFLGVQNMAGRAGSDQVHKTWLWWEQAQNENNYQIVRRHIQNDLEGQAKISIIGGMRKPDVLEVTPVTEQDLLLNWQELLIRMIANAFGMSAMALGVEHDVNRALGTVLDDKDFRSAVVPIARKLEDGFTRKILHDKLGWYDLKFEYVNIDDPDAITKMDLCARLYACNATTPNLILKKMGQEPLVGPYADLTQFEAMMVNTRAGLEIQFDMQQKSDAYQDDRQQKQMQDQQDQFDNMSPEQQQQQMMQQQGTIPPGGKPGGPEGAGGAAPPTLKPDVPAPAAKVKVPTKLALPKFSVPGAAVAASKALLMPVNDITNILQVTGMSAAELIRAAETEDPNVLEEISDEVVIYLEYLMKQEETANKVKLTPQMQKKWGKELKKRKITDDRRIYDFAEWMLKKGQRPGKPGGGSAKGGVVDRWQPVPAGRPGNVNPLRKG